MTVQASYDLRIKTRQSPRRCAPCPPDRVCAWSCIQGAGVEDLIAGLVLQSEGKLAPSAADPGGQAAQAALWDSFNL